MARTRRTYSPAFTLAAANLITVKGYSFAEAAKGLGIGETLRRHWKQQLDAEAEQTFPGHGNLPPLEVEIRRLRADNKRLQMERDMLKKATAFFAAEAR